MVFKQLAIFRASSFRGYSFGSEIDDGLVGGLYRRAAMILAAPKFIATPCAAEVPGIGVAVGPGEHILIVPSVISQRMHMLQIMNFRCVFDICDCWTGLAL